MLIEAISRPIRYRLRDGQEIHLQPGIPADLPERQAQVLLEKAAGRVRLVPAELGVKVEAAPCQHPVYWTSPATGELRGPGRVTHLAQVTDGDGQDRFWCCVEYEGSWRWVREDLVRKVEGE